MAGTTSSFAPTGVFIGPGADPLAVGQRQGQFVQAHILRTLKIANQQAKEANRVMEQGTPEEKLSQAENVAMMFNPMGVTLYHGGRMNGLWDPKTIGSGEGMNFQANGPGLYAGDIKLLAERYVKYGGDKGRVSTLDVDDSNIFNPARKLTPEHSAIYDAAVSTLDNMGLKASKYGLRHALRQVPRHQREEVRIALVKSGVDGVSENLGDPFGTEYSIFNPAVIRSNK
jgi:hypothetical protein